jgi:hypothetical protein
LEGKELKWAQKANNENIRADKRSKYAKKLVSNNVKYYKVDVEYEVTIQKVKTVNALLKHMRSDPKGNGIIMNKMEVNGQISQLLSNGIKTQDEVLTRLANFAKFMNNEFDPNTGAVGVSEGYKNVLPDFNFIYINDDSTVNASLLNILVHEAGHNMAKAHKHGEGGDGNGEYKYTQRGLQSSEEGKISPTVQNSRTIINDKTNRSTIP